MYFECKQTGHLRAVYRKQHLYLDPVASVPEKVDDKNADQEQNYYMTPVEEFSSKNNFKHLFSIVHDKNFDSSIFKKIIINDGNYNWLVDSGAGISAMSFEFYKSKVRSNDSRNKWISNVEYFALKFVWIFFRLFF